GAVGEAGPPGDSPEQAPRLSPVAVGQPADLSSGATLRSVTPCSGTTRRPEGKGALPGGTLLAYGLPAGLLSLWWPPSSSAAGRPAAVGAGPCGPRASGPPAASGSGRRGSSTGCARPRRPSPGTCSGAT